MYFCTLCTFVQFPFIFYYHIPSHFLEHSIPTWAVPQYFYLLFRRFLGHLLFFSMCSSSICLGMGILAHPFRCSCCKMWWWLLSLNGALTHWSYLPCFFLCKNDTKRSKKKTKTQNSWFLPSDGRTHSTLFSG